MTCEKANEKHLWKNNPGETCPEPEEIHSHLLLEEPGRRPAVAARFMKLLFRGTDLEITRIEEEKSQDGWAGGP